MRMIAPQVEAPSKVVAEQQEEYAPVSVALVSHSEYPVVRTRHGDFNLVLMAFRPSEEERAALAAGADLYISLLTFGHRSN